MSEVQRFFVCVNQKSGVGEDVAKALKKELKAQGLKRGASNGERLRVRVQTCNCLDVCKQCKKGAGAALIAYPDGTVYGNVRPADAAEIAAGHFGTGQVVKRLRIKE